MSILCRVFGHKPPQYGGAPHYAKSPPASIWTDGSGRGHVNLYGDCYRCGKNFRIISFHPPKEWVERAAQGDGAEPVAWMYCDDDEFQPCVVVQAERAAKGMFPYWTETPLYALPGDRRR